MSYAENYFANENIIDALCEYIKINIKLFEKKKNINITWNGKSSEEHFTGILFWEYGSTIAVILSGTTILSQKNVRLDFMIAVIYEQTQK